MYVRTIKLKVYVEADGGRYYRAHTSFTSVAVWKFFEHLFHVCNRPRIYSVLNVWNADKVLHLAKMIVVRVESGCAKMSASIDC